MNPAGPWPAEAPAPLASRLQLPMCVPLTVGLNACRVLPHLLPCPPPHGATRALAGAAREGPGPRAPRRACIATATAPAARGRGGQRRPAEAPHAPVATLASLVPRLWPLTGHLTFSLVAALCVPNPVILGSVQGWVRAQRVRPLQHDVGRACLSKAGARARSRGRLRVRGSGQRRRSTARKVSISQKGSGSARDAKGRFNRSCNEWLGGCEKQGYPCGRAANLAGEQRRRRRAPRLLPLRATREIPGAPQSP
jgi:hypothetical protein